MLRVEKHEGKARPWIVLRVRPERTVTLAEFCEWRAAKDYADKVNRQWVEGRWVNGN